MRVCFSDIYIVLLLVCNMGLGSSSIGVLSSIPPIIQLNYLLNYLLNYTAY